MVDVLRRGAITAVVAALAVALVQLLADQHVRRGALRIGQPLHEDVGLGRVPLGGVELERAVPPGAQQVESAVVPGLAPRDGQQRAVAEDVRELLLLLAGARVRRRTPTRCRRCTAEP